MTFSANRSEAVCGRLEVPSLAELRLRVQSESAIPAGTLSISETVADVQDLHVSSDNAGAMFQVASQFNLLEMVSPSVTPELGVDRYENDRTQGPACAIACGSGTIYRNYFAEVNGQIGQSAENQIDCLRDLGNALGNDNQRLWTMQNGYALPTKDGLKEVSNHLSCINETQQDALRAKLRIGIQWNTQVTLEGAAHKVSQAYCSAVPVSYSRLPHDLWEPFARLVLEASYEATLCAAVLNAVATGNQKVFLTLLGGGAFGNRESWILAAMERAIRIHSNADLDVSVVSYRRSNPHISALIEAWRSE